MSTILAVINIFLGLFVAYTQFRFINFKEKKDEYTWLKKLIGDMGLFWAAIYIYVVLSDLHIIQPMDPTTFGQVFIRPINTLWLGIIAAAGWSRLLARRRNRPKKVIMNTDCGGDLDE